MEREAQQLVHVVLFPFLAHGHMIPTFDLARLFAARDCVKATIITTPMNAPTFIKANENSMKNGGPTINIELFYFPAKEVGLPEGCDSPDTVLGPGLVQKFFKAAEMLSEQLEQYLKKVRPSCLIADMFFPWATDSAAKFNIPRLVFHGTSNFSICAQEIIRVYEPFRNVSSDEELFTFPLFPHEVKFTRLQVAPDLMADGDTELKTRLKKVKESEKKSYGIIVNSFYELEPDYANLLKKEFGRKTWNIGPVSLCNRSREDKVQRGKDASINEHECLKWLNSKKPNTVIYICFGSSLSFIAPQLQEIAMALELSNQHFIWVVRNVDGDNGKNEEWLPEGYEDRIKGKGLIIKGWAPQVLILEHEAVGSFVTHCGWNSTLEGITAGVPMVTWPVFAEQFYNEKLVTQILKTGVAVGAKKWCRRPSLDEMVKRDDIEAALREIMVGNEVEERRMRAMKYKGMAQKAVEEGGSSYLDLSAFINEIRENQLQNKG
ncbi:unnamed protein product [Amaranthus hypochondriacus]